MGAIRGRVVEQTNAGADANIDKLAKKYLGVKSTLDVLLERKGFF